METKSKTENQFLAKSVYCTVCIFIYDRFPSVHLFKKVVELLFISS